MAMLCFRNLVALQAGFEDKITEERDVSDQNLQWQKSTHFHHNNSHYSLKQTRQLLYCDRQLALGCEGDGHQYWSRPLRVTCQMSNRWVNITSCTSQYEYDVLTSVLQNRRRFSHMFVSGKRCTEAQDISIIEAGRGADIETWRCGPSACPLCQDGVETSRSRGDAGTLDDGGGS